MEYEEECRCLLSDDERVQSCYRIEQNGETHHHVTFTDDFTVCHNQLLEKWRIAGFELFSFGQNRTDVDNCTATFTGPS